MTYGIKLKAVALVASVLGVGGLAAAQNRPNIVLFLMDDWAWNGSRP